MQADTVLQTESTSASHGKNGFQLILRRQGMTIAVWKCHIQGINIPEGGCEMVKSKSLMTIGQILLGLSFSCGNPAEESTSQQTKTVIELTPRLIIGSEEYNEDYSFGAISDVDFLSDGSIAVLDRIKGCVSVYSETGEYIFALGASGQGPGEFTSPDCMMPIGDNLVIFERPTARASVFNDSGEYLGELSDTYSTQLPSYCDNVGDSGIVGGISARPLNGNESEVMYLVIIFDMELNPVDTLFTHTFILDRTNISHMIQNSLFSCSFTADDEGNVFVSPVSTENYRVTGFDQNLDTLVTINRSISRVEKTSQELAEESERMTSVLRSRNPAITAEYEPIRYRYMIPPNGIHTDSHRRIWVRSGLNTEHVFHVYSYSGDHLVSFPLIRTPHRVRLPLLSSPDRPTAASRPERRADAVRYSIPSTRT